MAEAPFWKTKPLAEMSTKEWESLCDGCAKCCLHKLSDGDDGQVFYTLVACRLLDLSHCTCSRYPDRQRLVPDCVVLTPENVTEIAWLPSTCAYRLVAEGRDLAWWHPLVSGDPSTVHQAGESIGGRAVSERTAGNLEHYVLDREP